MKKALCLIIAAVIAAAAYMAWVRYVSERSIVIISTTDVHAKVENFPRLATAIARCRDTVATIVADAGDRWTGNAYVDVGIGLMTIFNMLALYPLSGEALTALREYEAKKKLK